MKTTYTLILFVLIIMNVSAQDEATLKRLNGILLENNLFTSWNQGAQYFEFRTELNPDSKEEPESINGEIFNVRNDRKNTIRIYLEFYNPLRYKIKTDFKEIDDPSYIAITDFASELSKFTNVLSPSSNAQGKGTANPILDIRSRLLFQWLLEFNNSLDTNIFNKDPDSKIFVNLLKSKIEDLESFLYGDISFDGKDYPMLKLINKQKQSLYDQLTYNSFSAKLDTAILVNAELKKAKNKAEIGLKFILDFLNDPENLVYKEGTTSIKKNVLDYISKKNKTFFLNYCFSTAFWINELTKGKIEVQSQPLPIFDKLITELAKFRDSFNGTKYKNYRMEYKHEFPSGYYKMREYTYELSQIKIDGSAMEDTTYRCSFTIAKDEPIAFTLTSGGAFSYYKNPEYALENKNGQNYISEIESPYLKFRPAVFLNMIFRMKSDYVAPFCQVGLSYNNNNPAMLLGAGCQLARQFSISVGVFGGLRKDLTKYQVGDPVPDDATLQNDLGNHAFLSGYISFNINLSKVKK